MVARQPGAQSTQRTEILQVQEDASQRETGRDTCSDAAGLGPEEAQAWLMPTASSYRRYPEPHQEPWEREMKAGHQALGSALPPTVALGGSGDLCEP